MNQINLLEIFITNFFKVNNVIANSQIEIKKKLEDIANAISIDLYLFIKIKLNILFLQDYI